MCRHLKIVGPVTEAKFINKSLLFIPLLGFYPSAGTEADERKKAGNIMSRRHIAKPPVSRIAIVYFFLVAFMAIVVPCITSNVSKIPSLFELEKMQLSFGDEAIY